MESLSDTLWDVVICGTGLQQSLLALSLSRSGKNILHIDPNEYYGGPDAALSLQEAEAWVGRLAGPSVTQSGFQSASILKPEGSAGLSFPRAYSIALSPQLIHSRSKLLSQLVSSRAYRQVEFLAVGSFFVFKPCPGPDQKPSLARIPSTREDIGFDTTIPLKGKRSLMKFLKFVQDHESEASTEIWKPYADGSLTDFLQRHFKIDAELQTYIIALTLSLDGKIATRDGLAILYRHLTSMGLFGLGFAAVYPKWGGISEIAQVACRAGAVGGAVYMLGTGIQTQEAVGDELQLQLTNGETVKTKRVVRTVDSDEGPGISRLIAIVGSALKGQFEAVVEGAPLPAVSVIAFPPASLETGQGELSEYPVHMSAHSSDTGECPVGQSVLYLTTVTTASSKELLSKAVEAFLEAINEDPPPQCLFQLYYEQRRGSAESVIDGAVFKLPDPSLSLCFDDAVLESVEKAWKEVMGDVEGEAEYMTFPDREGVTDEDDVYD